MNLLIAWLMVEKFRVGGKGERKEGRKKRNLFFIS